MTPREFAHLPPQLFEWLEALCEDRMTPTDAQQLEQLVLRDATARRIYLAYLDLHGVLHWNTACDSPSEDQEAPLGVTRLAADETNARGMAAWMRRQSAMAYGVGAALILVIAGLSFSVGRWGGIPDSERQPVVRQNENVDPSRGSNSPRESEKTNASHDAVVSTGSAHKPLALPNQPKLQSAESPKSRDDSTEIDSKIASHGSDKPTENSASRSVGSPLRGTNADLVNSSTSGIVSVINDHLAAGWKLQGVEPSPLADDAEWLRRLYLDVVGHIPPVDVAERFLSDRSPRKRERLVESLLESPDYVRHWTNVWTNILIGRSDSRDVDRAALQKYLRTSFAKNRPWSELVKDFIAAEGRFDQNGATNFLLAHLNNQAVPATAITAKIFLGRQIGCTQCHDHPFNDWKQETFWSFNSFFQQTKVARAERRDEKTGKMKSQAVVLETKPVGGPTHFETRRGFLQATYPKFEGTSISDDPETNRRDELAKLMTAGDKPMIAEAFVNRMWEHFFGCGFTRPVDDMGPHNPPSHPELLDHLAREFVASGYDAKQLIRWICLSDAYQRSSRFGTSNESDDPTTGATPLFSRVYVKGMTAEQLYDSLLLATGADRTPLEKGDHDRRRHEWLQQFVHAFQTDENDESMTFESSMTQALLMMNSDLTKAALSTDRGTLLERLIHGREPEADRIKQLCLATLTRYPTSKEQAALRRLVHEGSGTRSSPAGWQDALWAYLNSSEFVLIH